MTVNLPASASLGASTIDHYDAFRYEQTRVRVFTIDGQRWAVAADICAALELRDTTRSLARLEDDDKLTIRRSDTPHSTQGIWNGFAPQVQSVVLISENGATDVILESRKPEARRFRRWLTHTVWPAIRDTGTYSSAPALTGPELVAAALIEANRMLQAKDDRIAELEPPAAAWNELAEAAGDYSVADAAKVLSRDPNISTGERRLFTEMAAKSWIYRREGRWHAYQSQVDNGRLVEKLNHPYVNHAGETVTPAPTIRITSKGVAALHTILGGSGQQLALAVAE